ncbi:M23 family metallopeptidase [Microbacterium sp.]|uniref:murein hydrolase activator EnvC family protein n=1 Tax=Microbacterium sp. TaxID=51671 RepID=UPI002B52FD40|nr:M23 family metallopeptidase [Microbacterium sp.]HWK78691.1 M23 family metallopeptidase [Microbacterium sp.]
MPSTNRIMCRASAVACIGVLAALLVIRSAAAAPPSPDPAWQWPVAGAREVMEPFRAPEHEYGAGHRGVDIAADPGAAVIAPADGVVAFRGVVVDRPLLTIDHGGGYVTTFEPLESDLSPGAPVHAGDEIGTVAAGGHAAAGTLHVGLRLNGIYINPMLMFGGIPRAVLLPCCESFSR